jgi:hypothetical protein
MSLTLGADPVGCGRPGRALRYRIGLIWLGEERVQGDPRGPGGPPYSLLHNSQFQSSDIGLTICPAKGCAGSVFPNLLKLAVYPILARRSAPNFSRISGSSFFPPAVT